MIDIDVLIIHPGAAHGIYGSDLANSLIAVEPPLWPRLIAGYVRDLHFSPKIIDAEAFGYSPEQVADIAIKLNPRLIAIAVYGHQPSASTQQMVGASATAKALKEARCECPVLMLGGHVSALPERTLREEAVDFVCTGEGPETVVGLLRFLKGERNLDEVPGLGYIHDAWVSSVYKTTKPAPLIDVNKLHGDTWDLLPMSQYRAHNWQCFNDLSKRQPYASIYTSLGCPYKCHFCCINAPFDSNRYRMRDPNSVIKEFWHLYERYGVKTFKIVDEMFILNEKHYTAIANGLIDSGLGDEINIWAYSRVDTVKPETLTLLRRAGFRWLALGIESGSKFVRDGANKRLKFDDIKTVVSTIQAADINVIGNYIFGLPDDNFESMQETLDLALDLRCEFANFYSAHAYPGSPLYTDAIKNGWTLPNTWSGFSQHNPDCRPLDTLHISGADVLRFRDNAFNIYFTDPGYLEMIKNKFGAKTLSHVKDMTKFRLKRKLLEAA